MSKVLVLGAGASLAYGFPLGAALRQRILNISTSDAKQAGIIRESTERKDTKTLLEFQASFQHSQIYSIDAFLGRRPEFAEIGKKCIAAALLNCEDPALLFSEDSPKDHWYQYLFNHWAKKDWPELNFDDVSIITFNYDRSLEHFLYVALQAAYGKPVEDVAQKLKSLRILHVYGSLSDELPNSGGYLKYDGRLDIEKTEAAAKGLVVIPEGRIDSPTLITARKWLSDASAIGFLGFGFDSTNVDRLAKDGACEVAIKRQNSTRVRFLCGTRIGIYDAELKKAFASLTKQPIHASAVNNFLDLNCTNTLRATLLLDR